MEAALKASIRKEMAFCKPQAFNDDLFLNVPGGVSCDDFSVDELLDFSNGEEFDNEEEEDDNKEVPQQQFKESSVNLLPVKDDFGTALSSELSVPVDDLANLEWLSHFVEDSNTEYATPFPYGIRLPKEEDKVHVELVKPEPACSATMFKIPVPARARSKRSRAGIRIWPVGTTSTESTSPASSSSSGSYTSSCNQLTGSWVMCSMDYPPEPKPTKIAKHSEGASLHQVGGRRCSHCGVQKTPQWRAGPLGAKTLCNACGVRYKSGRLLPEYRPACSPTFSSDLHSNSHRKVLEMRKKKQSVEISALNPCTRPFPETLAVADMVSSF